MSSLVFALALLVSIYLFVNLLFTVTQKKDDLGQIRWAILIIVAVLWGIYHYLS